MKTNQEINEAVAQKLGKPKTCSHCTGVLERHQCETTKGPEPFCGCQTCHPKDYCHSIEAAWEIVDQWHGDWELHRQNGQYDFVLYRPSEQYDGQADTAPMAICLAFLKLP